MKPWKERVMENKRRSLEKVGIFLATSKSAIKDKLKEIEGRGGIVTPKKD